MNNSLDERLQALKKKELLPQADKVLSSLLSIPRIEEEKVTKEELKLVENDYEDSIFGNSQESKSGEKIKEEISTISKPLTKAEKIASILKALHAIPHDNNTKSTNTEVTMDSKLAKSDKEIREQLENSYKLITKSKDTLLNVDKLEKALLL